MEISKSTPYVRYRENISSTLHKGTIHIESEYLDRERKTTIESIEGQTWQNMVNGENKEEEILPRLGLKIEGNEDVLDSKEQHMPIDTIIGDVEPVANEDGTYTYEISTMEGSYAKTLDGENNFSLTSDGLVGDMYIKYNAQGEEVNGSIVMSNGQSSYTIENSNTGEIKSAILTGQTLVNLSNYELSSSNEILCYQDYSLQKNKTVYTLFNFTDKIITFNTYANSSWKGFEDVEANSKKILTLNDFTINEVIGRASNGWDKTTESEKFLNGYMIIEGDYTNVDVPYFEGMQSVKVPVLTTFFYTNLINENDKSFLTPYFYPNKLFYKSTNNTHHTLHYYNADKVKIGDSGSEWSSKTQYQPPYGTVFVRMDYTADTHSPMLGYNNEETYKPFTPIKSNILTVNEDVELRGIGDVQDTLNCLTGELTQRVGEVVLNGSEGWSIAAQNFSDGYIYQTLLPLKSITKNNIVCDKLQAKTVWGENTGDGITINGSLSHIQIKHSTITTVANFKAWLASSPLTVQYGLENPTIKTIDLTIKDQDNKIIQSLHTHPSTTHVNLSSDGLIPNAEINYTMYGNIGETTGEQITDGTDSKLIEGKVYGDTLLNVLSSPSLKNSMDDISMQKLNNGYDNINVVDGEFKSAILQGRSQSQTLPTNIFNNWENKTGTYTPTHTQDGYFLFTGGNIDIKVNLNDIPTFKRNVEYTFIFRIKNSTYNGADGNILRMEFGSTTLYTDDVKTGIWKTKMSFSTSANDCYVRAYAWPGSTGSAEISLQIIEGDYTNIDVPESSTQPEPVVMPSLMTCGKNLVSGVEMGGYDNFGNKINGTYAICTEPIYIGDGGTFYAWMDVNGTNRIGSAGVYYHAFDKDKKWTRSFNGYEPNNTLKKGECYIVFRTHGQYNEYINGNYKMMISKDPITTYEPHQSNTLSTPEDITLRAIGDVRDELDCLTGQLIQRIGEDGSVLSQEIVKTVDISIVDQDNQPQTVLHSFANGYINVTSQGSLPKVTYEVPTSNSYYLDMVKPNIQYTSKSSSDCNAIIDGTTYPLSANGTFTTPSTITDNLMVLDAQVNDLMFIEGDLTGRELDYFTGMQSVDMPVLTTHGKNLFDEKNIILNKYQNSNIPNNSFQISSNEYNAITGFVEVKGNTTYTISNNISYSGAFYNKDKQPIRNARIGTPTFTTPSDCAFVVLNISMDKINNNEKFQIEEGTVATPYEPYQLNILTTNEPIALHKVGDVKDELDLVNEYVVRRIGKVILDGSENWKSTGMTYEKEYAVNIGMSELIPNAITPTDSTIYLICDKLKYIGQSIHIAGELTGYVCSYHNNGNFYIRMPASSVDEVKAWLANNKPTLYCKLATPTTEPVRIIPQNHRQSTTSLTLQSPLQKVGNVADQLRWNPYKGHYVRYNYIQDGAANSTYIFEDLKDMNERKFVNLYNQRTYIDTDHTVQVNSHGISRYCLAEQGKQYQVRWDWVERPSVDTIKVDLCGNVKEIPSGDNSVVIDVEKFTHQFVQIQGLGLTGKITNLMVIETINGEIPDVDFFSGIQCVGNTVIIDGNTKVQIDMEQTNGNLLDGTVDNLEGKSWRTIEDVRPNQNYSFNCKALSNETYSSSFQIYIEQYDDNTKISSLIINSNSLPYNFTTNNKTNNIKFYTSHVTDKGNLTIHRPIELCYADMAKDGIRPRYYDKESFILPMKLCRIGNIYDNLYYDDLRGCYRIQQSIGHKYFTGETTEVWTMETTNGYRTIKFTCTNANIDQIAYGETICNSFKHLPTINDDMEGFIIYNGNFVIRVDKDRLIDKTVDGFKALLASSPIHLFYQLKTPQMINLTEYPKRIELNTYRDEIFTFLKGMNPTKFTLSVPMDKTYRYVIEEEGQGLANRVTVNNETISAENMVAIKEVRGQGIANIIEDVNNVVITPRPNHEGRTTSHTLNNTKPAIIFVHGFEPSGDTAIGKYNVTDKAYQLKVVSSNGDNSLSDYYVLNVPYKLETYADGTKDVVYYDEAYKQWIFKGSSVKEYTVASNGTLSETIEIFRGLAPRSGMIAEFKLMFTSGTTAARMYYSLDGITYGYTQLRGMSDGNYLYVGIFNTGGTKIDIAYKTDPNAEYTNLVPLSAQVPECFMVNQITNCTFCELTLDKQYIYSEMKSPIELDTYDGTTKVFMDGNATDTNIIIRNEGTSKIVNTYTDTDYTVYWKYVDGLGNLRVTLGGTTVEVDGKQEYATLKTQLNAPQELLYVGGYNLSIKDLMVVKGAKIDDLPYFEGSRQVGTLVLDEEGNKSYKITLVQGGSVLEQRDENAITFKDDNKHNVVVHKIVGVCPTKVD